MTALHQRVHTVLESFQVDYTAPIDQETQAIAQALEIFILIVTIDLATTLTELKTLDGVTPWLRKRGVHVQPMRYHRQDLAARIAGYWQAFSDVCTVFLEHSPKQVVEAIFAPLNRQMAEFWERWPNATPYPLFYPAQQDTMLALWQHCAPLPPTPAGDQQ